MANKRITTDLRIVEIDETRYWADDIAAKAGKIFQVYLYDASVQTYLAELSPSCRLVPLYFNTEIRVDDDTHEIMMRQENRDEYVHARSLEAMTTTKAPKGLNFRFTNSESKHYESGFDRAVEELQADHPL